MLANQNLKKSIFKYFCWILLFFIFYHGLIRPLQILTTNKIVKPLIEKKIVNNKNYKLVVFKHHVRITHKYEKNSSLKFSIPFGQGYFFILFFLRFKPKTLILIISMYNLLLIPLYIMGLILFLNGYFILGFLITLNEKIYRLIHGLIIFLRIINREQFNLIFDNLKK